MKRYAITALALARCVTGFAGATTAPELSVHIKPGPMSPATGRGEVEVTLKVPAVQIVAGVPLFSLETLSPGIHTPQPVTDVTVSDAEGSVVVTSDNPGAPQWTSNRDVHGDLVIHYRLPIDNGLADRDLPPVSLRIDGDGFSSSGHVLIAQPNVPRPYRLAIDWDLSAMDAGSEGVSTFGDGNVVLPAGPVGRLQESIYMAGRLHREPPKAVGTFSAVWLGDAEDLDPRPVMQWTGELHAWMSRFFRDKNEPPYRVFLRHNPYDPSGGVALSRSFLVTYGPGVTDARLESILPHEMTHTWTAAGFGKWYDEGNAVYYQALLPWRAHLLPTAQFLENLNFTAARYYTNLLIHAPDSQIGPDFWKNIWLNVLPYDRGAMYFAVLNGKIRHASGGRRSVDDLIRTMVDRAQASQPVSEEVWVGLLRQALGAEGVEIHRSMMAGGLMLPASDDFGPCFRRVQTAIRRYELGFDAKSADQGKIIQNLTPESEAAKAGLRVGDVVKYAITTDGAIRDPAQTLTVQVTRDGRTFPITYLPRGEAVDAYQWELVPGVPDSRCRY
jgi:hypothetical protein